MLWNHERKQLHADIKISFFKEVFLSLPYTCDNLYIYTHMYAHTQPYIYIVAQKAHFQYLKALFCSYPLLDIEIEVFKFSMT